MLAALLLSGIVQLIIIIFSTTAPPNVAAEQDSEIPALEDILEEEVETARVGKSKEMTPKVAKLQVPQK